MQQYFLMHNIDSSKIIYKKANGLLISASRRRHVQQAICE